jgi:integral membrane sensor domain MASE1
MQECRQQKVFTFIIIIIIIIAIVSFSTFAAIFGSIPKVLFFIFLLAQQPALGQGLLIREVSRSHTTHHSR